MTYYKSWRLIDGKPRLVIVDKTGKIVNRNATEDELKCLIEEPCKDGRGKPRCGYIVGATCYRCIEEKDVTKKSILRPGNAYQERDKDGKETGRCICCKHRKRDYGKYDQNSWGNFLKSLADCRTDNQDPNSNCAKGDLFQELTCAWRSTISTVIVEDLNKKLDNYRTPIDHSCDSELGTIQTKGCFYNSDYRTWSQNFKNERSQIDRGFNFDVLILYCASKDGKYIERLYIFPVERILERTQVSIVKNPKDRWGNSRTSWYDQYRITDKATIEKVNKIWKEIIDKKTTKN